MAPTKEAEQPECTAQQPEATNNANTPSDSEEGLDDVQVRSQPYKYKALGCYSDWQEKVTFCCHCAGLPLSFCAGCSNARKKKGERRGEGKQQGTSSKKPRLLQSKRMPRRKRSVSLFSRVMLGLAGSPAHFFLLPCGLMCVFVAAS